MDRGVFAHSRSNSSSSDAAGEPTALLSRQGSRTASTTVPPARPPPAAFASTAAKGPTPLRAATATAVAATNSATPKVKATPSATVVPPMPALEPVKLQSRHSQAEGIRDDDMSSTSHPTNEHGRHHHHHNGDDNNSSSNEEEAGEAEAPRRVSRTQRDEAELKKLFSQYVIRISFFLWCQGLINNFHYNMVISGANSLAANFGMTQYVALISFMNVFFGIIARIMNAFVAHRISYNIRMTLMACGTIVGLLIVSFSGDIGGSNDTACFVVLLIGVAFTGTSYSYGETVALSFVQRYPPNIVGAWGSGTGISGVITALLFIALNSAGLSLKVIFLITLPLAVCYWFVFCFGLVAPHKVVTITYTDGSRPPEEVILHRGFEHKKMRELEARMPEIEISDYTYRMIMNFRGLSWSTIPPPATMYGKLPGGNVVNDEDVMYAPTADAMDEVAYENRHDYKPDDLYYPCCRFMCGCCSRNSGPRRWWGRNGYVIGMLHNKMFWFFFNLAVVYIAEYAAQFMAPFSFYCKVSWEGSFWISNSYTITQFCYQLGVFISRSSLMCVKIPYVGVISILQVINAVGWLVQAKTKFISIHSSQSAETGLSFLLFAWMLFVGLLGGASYVNVFYLILCRGQAMQQKEEDESIRQYLEARPALNEQDDGLSSKQNNNNNNNSSSSNQNRSSDAQSGPGNEVSAGAGRKPLPREGVVEDRSTATNTASEAEVIVTTTPATATTTASGTTLKKRGGKKKKSATTPPSASKGLGKKEVEGRIMHSDSESSEEDLLDPALAAAIDVPLNPDADPTLVRLGMPNRKLSDAEADEIEMIRASSAEEWQRRRELSMSMGSLYAMVGICIGTILDVIFTNTILTTKSTCVAD